jgi:beta-lactamase superfamily II metal-dependent hydrolase
LISNVLSVYVLSTHLEGCGHGRGEPWLEALDAIDPQDIVVSVGEDNKHDHPHQEMIDIYNSAAGSDHVRQTCLDGTLVMTVTSEGTYELQPDPSYAERFGWDPSDQQKTPHLRLSRKPGWLGVFVVRWV